MTLALLLACSAPDGATPSDSGTSLPPLQTDTAPPATTPADTPTEVPTTPPDPCAQLGVAVGTGDLAFAGLSDGDTLPIVHGAQGGWHLLVAARVLDSGPEVELHLEAVDVASGVVVSDQRLGGILRPWREVGCQGDRVGIFAVLDVHTLVDGDANTPPELLDGHAIALHLSVEDRADGRLASTTVTVIAQEGP